MDSKLNDSLIKTYTTLLYSSSFYHTGYSAHLWSLLPMTANELNINDEKTPSAQCLIQKKNHAVPFRMETHQHRPSISLILPIMKSLRYWVHGMKHFVTDTCFLFGNFPLKMSRTACEWWGHCWSLSRSQHLLFGV
jgi:hypothetical protein